MPRSHSTGCDHHALSADRGQIIVTVSERLGRAKPSVALAIYAHMFTTDDSKAAAAVRAVLNR
jgi:hypothetical protein